MTMAPHLENGGEFTKSGVPVRAVLHGRAEAVGHAAHRRVRIRTARIVQVLHPEDIRGHEFIL